jgi:hypothetical protein
MNEEFIELTQYNTLPLCLRKSAIDGYYRRDGLGITRVLVAGNSIDVKETYEEITEKLNDTIYSVKTEYREI